MESAFGWLGEIFSTLLNFIPQIVIIRATHAGVKFKAGRTVKVLMPDNGIFMPCWLLLFGWIPCLWFMRTGVHFYWPVVTECEVVPVKRQTTNLSEQYLCTADKQTLGVGGILVYEVTDVEKLLTECFDYEDTIRDLSLTSIKSVVTSHSLATLLQKSDEVDKELTKTLKSELRMFGIKVIKATLSDLTPCRMLGLWGSLVNISSTLAAVE